MPLVRLSGAALAALLFWCACQWAAGIALLPVAVALLCTCVSRENNPWVRCAALGVFYATLSLLQMPFFVRRAPRDGWDLLLLPLLNTLLLWLPAAAVLLACGKRKPAEATACALLAADFVFCHLPVGNHFFQLGLPWMHFPRLVVWLPFAGPCALSLWTVATGHFLHRVATHLPQRKCLIATLSLLCVLAIPPTFSLLLVVAHEDKPPSEGKTRKVAWVATSGAHSFAKVDTLLASHSFCGTHYLLLPEAFLSSKSRSGTAVHPFSTRLARMARQDSATVLYGITEQDGTTLTNAIRMVSPRGNVATRYKSHKIPFSEYLPGLFGKSGFFRKRMLYRLTDDRNTHEVLPTDDMEDTLSALICYESLSPAFVCQVVREGAEVLFVHSCGTWVGSPSFDRMAMLLLREAALLTGREMVRCAEDAASLHIGSDGRVRSHAAPPLGAELHRGTVTLHSLKPFYARHQKTMDWIYASLLTALVGMVRQLPTFIRKQEALSS